MREFYYYSKCCTTSKIMALILRFVYYHYIFKNGIVYEKEISFSFTEINIVK
jgi:hypothetical protein